MSKIFGYLLFFTEGNNLGQQPVVDGVNMLSNYPFHVRRGRHNLRLNTCCLVWVNRCCFAGNPTGSYAPEPYVCGNTKRVVSEHCLLRPHSVSPHSSSAASSSGLTVALSPVTQQRKTATSQTALVRQGQDHLGMEAHLQPEMQTSQAHLRP